MCLSGPVIGVLPQDHHFHRVQRCQVQRGQTGALRWMDCLARGFLGPQEPA